MTHVIDLGAPALEAGLAIARGTDGVSFVALRMPVAPVAAAAALIDAWPDRAAFAWASPDSGLVLVGIDVARQARGTGPDRWSQLVAGARISVGAMVLDGDRVASLGLAAPRWVGGAAFAPGAADKGPWAGFGDAWFALPRWTYVHDGTSAYLVLAVDRAEAAEAARWRAELAAHGAALAHRFVPAAQPETIDLARASAELWRAQVEAITSAIGAGTCAKIVAARTCTVTLAGTARPADLLAVLDARHAECTRVLVRPPGGGTLVAASPERLVRRTGELVQCDALAGTIRGGHAPLASTNELLASKKDRWEHDLVVSAIRDALASTGATVDAPAEPGVRALRHVLHLHTPIRAIHTDAPSPHVLELAARLHPTPAVGGTPQRLAVDWIAEHEPVPRGWYASPVGWFDLDGNGELCVAIRSGVLAGNRAHLWAGAGIVAGSDPDRELAETELKLRAMLGALGVTEPVREAPAVVALPAIGAAR